MKYTLSERIWLAVAVGMVGGGLWVVFGSEFGSFLILLIILYVVLEIRFCDGTE